MRVSFAIFFSLYMMIYGGIHAYVYFRLRSAIGRGWKWTAFFVLLSLFMMMASRVLWIFDLGHVPLLRTMLSYSGYMWMAFIFLLFTAFVFLDLLRLLVWLIDLILSARFGDLLASPKLRAWIALGFAVFVTSYGWFEARAVRPVHLTIATDKLPQGVDRLRVAQITDVHLGWIIQEERLDRMLEVVRAARPDLLVSTGDLVDGDMEAREAEAALFRGLNLPLGIYAVTGNHEYYAGVEQAVAFKERSGMQVLRNEALRVGGIIIAGVDDPTARRFGYELKPEHEVLAPLPENRFVLLLKHQPAVDPESVGYFDLQLSGHTHRGQIWPFYWATRMVYEYRPWLRALAPSVRGGEAYASGPRRESQVYVSSGTGTWGPPIRFLSPPEVTIVDIVRK
jgi:hypothetical protein